MNSEIIGKLIKHWEESNVYSPPKESFLLDYRLEKKRIKLPDDFKYLYQFVGGTTDCDNELFLFYPPEELTTMECEFALDESDELRDVVIFVDYMQACWWYGFRITNKGYEIGIIPTGNKFKVITNSLAHFIDLYINDSDILYDYR